MLFVGITGGVGAGKSAVLDYLKRIPASKVMLTDEIAHELMEPGTACYEKLREEFPGADIYEADGHFDRKKLAAFIFGSDENRSRLNKIVHPAVKDYVREQGEAQRAAGKLRLLVVESALLIEERYDEFCDEMWYIYTSEENRRARLKASRGYSDAKIDSILASQLSEAEFRSACSTVIDNNCSIEETEGQIGKILLARGIILSI